MNNPSYGKIPDPGDPPVPGFTDTVLAPGMLLVALCWVPTASSGLTL
jgi:hypothetical protein